MSIDVPAGVLRLGGTPTDSGQRTLYDGYLNRSEQSAAALLLVARIARARFYTPPAMLAARIASADPVITVANDRIRFESFSACCGVAARYDVLAGGLDALPSECGTTNVDLNGPAREVLSGVYGTDPLRIRVTDGFTITTLDGEATETKVPLPSRWVRGFAESQASGSSLVRRAELNPTEARGFLRSLPRTDTGSSVLYATTGRSGLSLTSAVGPAFVPLGGPSRLRVADPILDFATSLTVYGPEQCNGPGVSLWQIDLPDARFTLALSPTPSRGFSGEGGLLHNVAEATNVSGSLPLVELIPDGNLIDADKLADQFGLDRVAVAQILALLAVNGSVGYDAAEGRYFRRQLPWTGSETVAATGRLGAARSLLAEGAVSKVGDLYEVRHGDSLHRVRGQGSDATCTCPWVARYGTTRGPCKHILAANIASQTTDDQRS